MKPHTNIYSTNTPSTTLQGHSMKPYQLNDTYYSYTHVLKKPECIALAATQGVNSKTTTIISKF